MGSPICRSLLLVALGIVAIAVSGCSETEAGEALRFEATLADWPVADSDALNPIELHHEDITELSLDVTNVSDQPVTIAHVRIEGQMLNLIFLTYDTGVREEIQPGEQRIISFQLDFFDLAGQAHGLLRSNIRLFDVDRNPLAQQALVIDGRGSPLATMAVFNLVLAAAAFGGLAWNIVRLAQRRLPANRFVRGLRFLHSGAVIGATAVATSSTIRIWPLTTTTWVPLVIGAGLIGFVVGYLAPGSEIEDDDRSLIDTVELAVINLNADAADTSPGRQSI